MSEIKMLKNERKNRRKAIMITTMFYLATIGGILFYTGSSDFSSYLPDQVKEWLQMEEPKEEVKKTKKPRA